MSGYTYNDSDILTNYAKTADVSSTYATKTSLGNYVAIANLTTNTFITNGRIRIDNADLYYPLIDSATISSNTVATTQSSSDNSRKIATTEFVKAQSYITSSGTAANVSGTVAIANGGTGATTASEALTKLGAYASSNPNGYITSSSLSSYAKLASPTFTGTVIAPTPATTSNDTTVATTEFVNAQGYAGRKFSFSFTISTSSYPISMTNTKIFSVDGNYDDHFSFNYNNSAISHLSTVFVSVSNTLLSNRVSLSSDYVIRPEYNTNYIFIHLYANGDRIGFNQDTGVCTVFITIL